METSEGNVIGFALVIAKGEQEGKSFTFDASARIGRNDDNDVVLDAPGISREHARIFTEDGRHFAEDLGSINGTKVNGAKIAGATELSHGDSVAVGQVVFAFVIKAAAAPDPVAPRGEDAPTQMVEALSEELFTRPPSGALPFEETDTSASSPPAVPSFEDTAEPEAAEPDEGEEAAPDDRVEADEAPADEQPEEAAAFEQPDGHTSSDRPPHAFPEPPAEAEKTVTAMPAIPEDAPTTLGMEAPVYADETTQGKGGRSLRLEQEETRIRQVEALAEEPKPVERQETRIFELPNAPGENARPSRVRPAISNEMEPTPILRRSGVKGALEPVTERRSGVKGALSPTGTERRSGVKAAIVPVGGERKSGVKAALAQPRASGVKPAMSARGAPQASAVEKARRRREANESLGKMLIFHWRELPRRTRYVLSGSFAAVVLGCVTAVVIALWPASASGPKGPEPTELSSQALPDSFGKGPGVTWDRPDLKSFEFSFNTPTQAVAVLHFQAKDIGPDEVAISVNGAQEGTIPPDSTNAQEREIEQVLSTRDLKRNARNVVVFDNMHNPPGEDTWQISGLRLEVIPIPELPKDQLLASAREYAARGKLMYEQRDIGSANLFKAWKNYRFAWLTLEAVNEKPELYQLVRYQLASIGRELDAQCGKLMLAARKAIELQDKRKAKQVLDEVNAYFPTAEHRCHNLALEKANEFDL